MLDLNTFDARWTLLIGVPLIAWLGATAWRRSRAVAKRIQDVRLEMARHPQNPYQALAALMAEEQDGEGSTGRKSAGQRDVSQKNASGRDAGRR